MKIRSACIRILVFALVFGIARVEAQSWPSKPVRMIVPQPPGGGTDIVARLMAEQFGKEFGQSFLVENRPGAGTLVGTELAAKAAPDGYTLLVGLNGNMALNPSLYEKLPYDPIRDFTAIGMIVNIPFLVVVSQTSPFRTIGDVVAIGKRDGSKLSIGTSAVGTGSYLSAELFKSVAGIDAALIPYKGTGQVMSDLLGNHVPIAFGVLPPALSNLQAGTLRAIAVLSPRRFTLLPDVPTASESGMPGFESVLHYGLLGPAGMARPIVERLNAALRAVVETDAVRQRVLAEGGDVLTSSPEEYAHDIDLEERKWSTLVRRLSLKVD